jgi:DNA adenine methylase
LKSPLRYPGGKSRAVKHILPHFPEDIREVCSPFLGGGSIELALAEKGIQVYGYDIFEPLIWFWRALLHDPEGLAKEADALRKQDGYQYGSRGLIKEDFNRLKKELKNEKQYSLQNAANFYALNRSSFSGATLSGGWSRRASFARFTDSSIDRIKNFKESRLYVAAQDFKDSIPSHSKTFLYLDPPYLLGKDKENLYGKSGDTHKGFDHSGLAIMLKERSNWILSYNNCPEILKLYKDYDILYPDWKYSMSSDKSSKEVLIINKENR